MGNQKDRKSDGTFSRHLYEDHPDYKTVVINGIKAKVVRLADDTKGGSARLPPYAQTSDMYFKIGADGKVAQAKLYVNQSMVLDFDWSHDHRNPGTPKSEAFRTGTVHVQEYVSNGSGGFTRLSDRARLMTDTEIEKYGPIIHHFNSYVKFRR